MEGGIRGIVVVISAMMIQVLAFGNYAIIGIYIVHFLDIFEGDAVGVSLVSGVHFATLLGMGPLVSFLMTKVSYRKLCLVGAALVSIGIFCTPLIVSLPALYVSFGVFAGTGGCLIYVPSHVLSGLYYDKYRALAVGVATCGTAMGGIVMPIIVGTLIEEYTWKGSLMVLAAIDCHLFIFAMMMVPPPEKPEQKDENCAEKKKTVKENGIAKSEIEAHGNPHLNGQEHYSEKDTDMLELYNAKNSDNCPDFKQKMDTSSAMQGYEFNEVWSIDDANETMKQVQSSSVPKDYKVFMSSNTSVNSVGLHRRKRSLPNDDITRILAPSYLMWSVFSSEHSVTASPIGVDGEDHLESDLYEPSSYLLDSKSANNVKDLSETNSLDIIYEMAGTVEKRSDKTSGWRNTLKRYIAPLLDVRFLLYLISTTIWSLTTTLFLTFAPDMIVNKGFTAYSSAILVTYFGVGQLVGCTLISIFGNILGRRVILYVVTNVFTGLFMVLVPQMCSYAELATMLVLEGIAYGGILGLYMIVTIDLVGVDDLDVGFGHVIFSSGVGCFLGPPIGGEMKEVFGNYDAAFYMSGLLTAVGGLIMLFIYLPVLKQRS